MTVGRIPNKTTALALNQKAINGVDKYFAHVKTFTLAGTVYTPESLKAVLQAEIDGDKAVDDGQAQLQQQVVAAKLARAKARGARAGLKAYVLGTSGADAVQMLKDLGIPVPKPRGVKTAESKAQAVGKATATRQAKKEAIASIDAPPPAPPASPAANVSPPKP
jgi:hypothetical protein